jgi:hypothetical protein
MTTVQPEGESIRKAAQWIVETRKYEPHKALNKLIEEACMKFDLSPLEAEFLKRFVKAEGL